MGEREKREERERERVRESERDSSSAAFFTNKDFHLVINLPVRGSGAFKVSAYRTDGYR